MSDQVSKNTFTKALMSRQFLSANAVAIVSLIFLLFFPKKSASDEYILAFVVEFALPACFVWFVLRRSLTEYGFGWGKRGIFFNSAILFSSLTVFLVSVWFFFSGTPIGKEFVVTASQSIVLIRRSFLAFLFFVLFSLWFTTLNEFFFRGFLLFTWKKALGKIAILAQIVFFLILIGLKLQVFSSGVFGVASILLFGTWSLIASLIAFSTESVLLSFCFSMFSDILTTVFVIMLS